ncbi:MAG: hypothetical protein H6704_04185 [Myxococcales bacterium]|nr:hypothetical protein [Myxococcales bacterium]
MLRTTPLRIAPSPARALDLEPLLTALRHAGVAVGVDDVLRLRRVFALEPALDAEGLRRVIAAVLVKGASGERATFDRVFDAWFERADGAAQALDRVESLPVNRRLPPSDSVTLSETPPAGGRARSAAWSLLVMAAAAGLALVVWPPDTVDRFGDADARDVALQGADADGAPPTDALTALPTAGEGGAEAPPAAPKDGAVGPAHTAKSNDDRGARPSVRPTPPPPPPPVRWGPFGVGVLALLAAAGLWRRLGGRTWLPDPAPPPTRPGPSRVPVRAPEAGRQLIDAGDEDVMVWGVGRFVSDEETDRLSVRSTIEATADAAGRPVLRYERAQRQREVWLWIDEAVDAPAVRRLVDEVEGALAEAGLPVERATFWGVPERLTLPDGRVVAPAELDERREHAVVAILTDGRLLEKRLALDAHRVGVRALLRTLSNWPRLTFVDFAEGAHNLAAHLTPWALSVCAPEGLPPFLGDATGRRPADDVLEGAERAWAAVCALPGRAVDEATALHLRQALDLGASPWALARLRAAAPGPGGRLAWGDADRARLLRWLRDAEAWAPGASPSRHSLLARALDAWDAVYAAEDAARRADEPTPPWVDTPAEHRLRADRALLDLWRDPDAAVETLYRAAEGPAGPAIRRHLARFAPWEHGDRPGCVALPWRLADRPLTVRVMLRALDFGAAADLKLKATLARPGRLGLALGLCLGTAVGAFAAAFA